MRILFKLGGLLALLLDVMILVGASDSTRVDKLGHRMMCACGCNQILLECNHVGCTYSDRMRGELVAAVDNGKKDSDVLQFFVEKYGTTVLAAPTRSGFDRVAWLMPELALLSGVGLVIFAVRRWRTRFAEAPQSGSALTPTELDRFRAQARKETEI